MRQHNLSALEHN